MSTGQTSSSNLRRFLIRRFAIVSVTVVAIILALVALEDFAFIGVIAAETSTPPSTSPGVVIHLAALLLSNALTGNWLHLTALGTAKLTALLVMLAALLFLPVIAGSVVFARMAERRIVSEQKARDAERAQLFAKRNLMISDMAHDLRTPVMSISGLAQALDDGIVKDEEAQKRYLRSIKAKSDKMADLVSMLFDFVQLESEGYSLQRVKLDLPQLVLQEAAAAYSDVEDAGMQLRVEVPETPVTVFADEKQLARVVANLIANATRHNAPNTTIVLGLNRRAGVVDIIVADDGKPIQSDVEKLFEPFTREDVARSGGGSGLGLSIVKTIVDLHGYRIDLMQPYGVFTKAFIVTCAVEV